MRGTFRWYGPTDPVTLREIKQVHGIKGIVSALYTIPNGEVWDLDSILNLKEQIEAAGFTWDVIESIPVPEDIKSGKPSRDKLIENFCQSVRNAGKAGIPVVCYNFMPIFDWLRTDLALPLADGSSALAYVHKDLSKFDLNADQITLPGWADAYSREQLAGLLKDFESVDEEQLWANLKYFLERVVPVAEQADVKLAIHPDDPPWSIFGLPRINTGAKALERIVSLVDSPANGITMCTGSYGPNRENDLPAMIRHFGAMGRIHFAHCRNVAMFGEKDFHESCHQEGVVDMVDVVRAYKEVGFTGPVRPDHGRTIWDEDKIRGEKYRPGYGLYDRAIGWTYLQGLWDAL